MPGQSVVLRNWELTRPGWRNGLGARQGDVSKSKAGPGGRGEGHCFARVWPAQQGPGHHLHSRHPGPVLAPMAASPPAASNIPIVAVELETHDAIVTFTPLAQK